MSERLQNVLRIMEEGAADRARTQVGLGVPAPAPREPRRQVGVHRIVDVGNGSATPEPEPAPAPAPPPRAAVDHQPVVESETDSRRRSAMVLYAPNGVGLEPIGGRRVDRQSAVPPAELDGRLVLLREQDSARSKSFRLLAHRVRHSRDPHVVLVTSARGGEGKTTAAANLALALAEDGTRRVLLLEANARTPVLARLFGVQRPIGLARQAARLYTAMVPWTTWVVHGSRLSLLPAEPEGDAAPTRGVFAGAISDLRRSFDHVIVDAPSVLDSADVNALVDSVDAVVIAARARRSKLGELTKAKAQLAPARMLGVVLLDSNDT
jgi:Mrp family chromosome partitioning ATPase